MFQDGAIHFIFAPERIHHLRFRLFGLWIPFIVSKLEISNGCSILVFACDWSYVHAYIITYTLFLKEKN
ncbi:hypothetical protein A0V43_06380 [Geobacillus sp. JS12]|nr:hypothetical protein A0V43_06380 [Geobacillus sp. JS12]